MISVGHPPDPMCRALGSGLPGLHIVTAAIVSVGVVLLLRPVWLALTQSLPGALHTGSPKTVSHRIPGASGPVNHFFCLLAGHPAGFMTADAVRYMSVHSWKQPDSHGHNGTSQRQSNSPRGREPQLTGCFRW